MLAQLLRRQRRRARGLERQRGSHTRPGETLNRLNFERLARATLHEQIQKDAPPRRDAAGE
jgi:histone H3/H4